VAQYLSTDGGALWGVAEPSEGLYKDDAMRAPSRGWLPPERLLSHARRVALWVRPANCKPRDRILETTVMTAAVSGKFCSRHYWSPSQKSHLCSAANVVIVSGFGRFSDW